MTALAAAASDETRVLRPSFEGSAAARRGSALLRPAAGLGLVCVLALGGFGLYAFQRMQSLDRELTTTRELMEGRLQKLDAGIRFDSRRQQLLLGIRDEILSVNPRLDGEVAYEYATQLVTACEKFSSVDPLLLLAIGTVESGFDAAATSPVRAGGLYQIWPSTGRLLAGMLDWSYSDRLLYEPGKNTTLAAFYLQILFTAYNDESLVLAEYNGGPLNAGYLRAGDGRLSAETRQYVARVLDVRRGLRKKFDAAGRGLARPAARARAFAGGPAPGRPAAPAPAAPGRTAAAG